MEKVLVIAYRFPPLDETSSKRSLAIAKYFKEFGLYPIIVTRNWERPLKNTNDQFLPSGTALRHVKHDDYEEYIVPFMSTLKYKSDSAIIRKILGFFDNILMYFNSFILSEYLPLIKQVDKIVKGDRSIKKAMVISDPHTLFYVGYKLKKKYGIEWIADYRDEWNTLQVTYTHDFKPGWIHRLVFKIHRNIEKRWVGTADYITSVSKECTRRISEFVGVKGEVVYNGFFKEDYQVEYDQSKVAKKPFEIIHNGTLYPSQKVEIFLEGLKLFIDKRKDIDIKITFLGILYKKGASERILTCMKGYERYVECTDRIPQNELFKRVKEANAVLHVSHGKEYTGLTSSKIFDHLALSKPVFCCPPDGDVVEELLTKSGLGIFAENSTEVLEKLNTFIDAESKGNQEGKIDQEYIMNFHRKSQTKIFVDLFKEM